MISTIIILVLIAAAVGLFFTRFTNGYDETRVEGRLVATPHIVRLRLFSLIPAVLAVIVLAFSSSTIVKAKTVGVPVTFGKPGTSSFEPGLHIKAPWTKVVKVDTTQQVANFNDGKGDTDHGVIGIELNNKSKANAYVSITWKANGAEATNIYGEYRSDNPLDLIYTRLIAPNIRQSTQNVLKNFNPMPDENGNNKPIDYEATAQAIRADFMSHITKSGSFVEVVDLKFSRLDLDESTQKRINEFNAEIQKTKNAEQAVRTAEQTARANKILSESLAKTDGGAVAYCLSLIEQGKLIPPVGFSCYPGSGSNLILSGNK